jgi:hypothetical protein
MSRDIFDNNLIPKNQWILIFNVLNSHLNVKSIPEFITKLWISDLLHNKTWTREKTQST